MTGRTIPKIQQKASQMEAISQDKMLPMPLRESAGRLGRIMRAIEAKQETQDEPPMEEPRVLLQDGTEYNRQLAERMAELISEEDDPVEAMDEIAWAAEQGGLIYSNSDPRRDNPIVFAMDLLMDNPMASDWMNCRLWYQPGHMPDPRRFTEISEIADRLK